LEEKMKIEKCGNGYIINCPDGTKRISHDIKGVFETMLNFFEGKHPKSHGDYYGRVEILYERPND
jgi:hypothetical protein